MVIADDRYIAADGAELVEVEYEQLPALVDPHKAMDADAPIIREDLVGKDEAGQGKRTHNNHIFTWDVGDKDATDRAFDECRSHRARRHSEPARAPEPARNLRLRRLVRQGQRFDLTVHITSQAPHIVRTVVTLLSGIPESKVRVISPDIGGGFGNKVGIYPGYVCAIVVVDRARPSGQVDRKPHRQFIDHRVCARLPRHRRTGRGQRRPHQGAALLCTGRSWRLQRSRPADQVAGGTVQHLHRLLRYPGRLRARRWCLHQQGARAAWPIAARFA